MGYMTVGQKLHGFEIIGISDLPEMNATGIYARHELTGLEVYHILDDDEENLFAYAFMTPPEDSTGVAHILEHSVLCGSEHYPLKDPFLVLAKQSVKTFLNAMTFPDKTVYPASSMVEADYFNLMSVYGDAVFFPLLTEDIFRQEGHRFEFAEDGSVSIQGVVFNEMRGNYSSFDTIAGDWSLRSLLAGTPYAHDSGGDPADIPALTYEQFRAFHAKYYHPVNCRVFLHGNIPTERQLELLQTKFLSRFSSAEKPGLFDSLRPFENPQIFEVPAPAGNEKDLSKSTVLINWLFPDATDPVALMEANLLTEILLGHDGSPLNRALLESGLGEDIAPSTGLETEIRHMCFSVGLRGVKRDRAEEFEGLVLDTIARLITDGIPSEDIETAVRSIDFSNREIRRSGGPFALTLMRRSLRGWIHGFGPEATLRYIPAFKEVKRRLSSNSDYIHNMLVTLLRDNTHRSRVTVYPDADYEKRLDEQLATRIRLFESGLDSETRTRLIADQKTFFTRQHEPDCPEFLGRIPHLSRGDLPVVTERIQTDIRFSGAVPILIHEQQTNGIAYADIAIPVDVLSPEDYPLLPFYASVLTNMGLDGLSWVETASLAARCTGGLGTMLFTSSTVPGMVIRHPLPSEAVGRDFLIVRVKMLEEMIDEAIGLVFRFLQKTDFSDTHRLADLLLEYRNDLDSSLAPGGHQYAVSRAGALTDRARAVDELWNGLTQIRYIRHFAHSVHAGCVSGSLVDRLTNIRNSLADAGMVVNLTGTSAILSHLTNVLASYTASYRAPIPRQECELSDLLARIQSLGEHGGVKHRTQHMVNTGFSEDSSCTELITVPLQVGFAAVVLPGMEYGSSDQPVEQVFGHWLSNGPLWEKIRMSGGAYGVFAYPDSLEKQFVFSTYRDPSPIRSLTVFREVLESAVTTLIDSIALEKIITGCYSREIQPRSPADKGFTAFIRLLFGITDEIREKKIARIISVTPEDMQKCAARILESWSVGRSAVIAGKKQMKDTVVDNLSGNVVRFTL